MAEEMRAEMSANVWKIVANVGESVDAGEPVMILESMKMEIPAITETGGTVSAVHVAEGETVQVGQLLAVLE